jgi:hypothetical protein
MGQLIFAGVKFLFPSLAGSKIAAGISNLLASVLFSAISARLSRPKASDVVDDLRRPNELPSYRYVWGSGTRAPGSVWYVGEKGGFRYFGYLVNSLISDTSGFSLRLDGRPVTLTGDPRATGELRRGVASIAEGETQTTITHGLGETPDAVSAHGADFVAVIDMITSTTFRVTIPEAAPAGGQPIAWVCCKSADGAAATNSPFVDHLEVWIQDGTDTHPPTKLLIANGDLNSGVAGPYTAAEVRENPLWHTDKMHGLTVIWLACNLGNAKNRRDRWPSPIPQLDCEMGWTPVWDPRDELQDPADPSTWSIAGNRNQALCLLNCALRNPVAPYRLGAVWLEAFADAADVADEDVDLKDGGTVKRWIVGGVQTFGARELPDILAELSEAGGGFLFTSGGRLGYRAATWVEPDMTLASYYREGDVEFSADLDRTSAPQAVRAVYADPGAGWEDATFEPYPVSEDWGGGEDRVLTMNVPLVSNPYVAMRLAKLQAERLKRGKRFSAVFPPNPAADAVVGTPVELALAQTVWRNGTYRVVGKDGAYFLGNAAGGVAMRVKLDLAEDDEGVYAWSVDDERPYKPVPIDVLDLSLPAPTDLDATFETDDTSGSRRLRVTFQAPGEVITEPNLLFTPDPDIEEFQLQWSEDDGPWTDGPAVAVPNAVSGGEAIAFVAPVFAGRLYRVQVRSVASGRVSEWTEAGPFLDAPPVVATGGTVTEDGVWRVHTFTASGDLVVTTGGLVEYVAVGGGAGGGKASGFGASGGGAGGEVKSGVVVVEAGTLPIVIGAGGVGGDGTTFLQGEDGEETTGLGVTAEPGAGGGGATAANLSTNLGRDGFHGGGGGALGSNWQGGTGTSGRNGGDGFNSSTQSQRAGGGGAGAGASGTNAASNTGGNGGAGVSTWAGDFGGGGGGGVRSNLGAAGAATHGGGTGSNISAAGGAAAANTGGGGGGTASTTENGGNGAAGRFVIRYRRTDSPGPGPGPGP